jgi:hypothetical protein
MLWIFIPAAAIILGAKSCANSPAPGDRPDATHQTLLTQSVPAPGVLNDGEIAVLAEQLTTNKIAAFVPTVPAPIESLRGRAQINAGVLADVTDFSYAIGDASPIPFALTVSSEPAVCKEQSVLQWSDVVIGASRGCVADNPNGGLFVEWVDRGNGIHVETTAEDRGAVLDWLGTWKRVG